MNGKKLFLQMNLILKFSTETSRPFIRHLPSETDAPFNFQPRIQGGAGSISVWVMTTAKGVDSLVFL